MPSASKVKKTVRIASGRKRVRQDVKLNAANSALRSKFRTAVKSVLKDVIKEHKRVIFNGDNYDINASGTLTIAGASSRIDMYVRGKVGADGSITFNGSKKIKMTDFKIKPPTALMGTLTTGDEVEIAFQITLKQF